MTFAAIVVGIAAMRHTRSRTLSWSPVSILYSHDNTGMWSALSSLSISPDTMDSTTSNNSNPMFSNPSTIAMPTMPVILSTICVSDRLVKGSITCVLIWSAAFTKVCSSFCAKSQSLLKIDGTPPSGLSSDVACLPPPFKWCFPVLPGAESLWCMDWFLLASAGVSLSPSTFIPVQSAMFFLNPSHEFLNAALAFGIESMKSCAVSTINFLITLWVTRMSCHPKRNSIILMTHSMPAMILSYTQTTAEPMASTVSKTAVMIESPISARKYQIPP
mmetsp:Transcript_20001/g.59873  ORF Transcript_20001/g.59873 Transcript_20001/m.59873 type:complete len:274 (+) Transcript_20001:830-1651(+)